MEKKNLAKTLPLTLLTGVLLWSCSRNGDSNNNAVEINNFEVHEVLKSATRNYCVEIDSMRNYLTVYTSVQWPLQFGDANLTPLRDSLLSRMYHVAPGTDIDRAISEFVSRDTIFGPDVKCTPIDSIPAEEPSDFNIIYTGKMIELTERTVTYQINANSYLGGAHFNYASYPFTYDLYNSCILTPGMMFRPGSEAKLLTLIKETLAAQEGVSVAGLTRADIFVDDLFVSPLIYLSQGGGGVVFHYNPYQIAPYSKGAIDVEVPAFELTPYLTARADSLINQ